MSSQCREQLELALCSLMVDCSRWGQLEESDPGSEQPAGFAVALDGGDVHVSGVCAVPDRGGQCGEWRNAASGAMQ